MSNPTDTDPHSKQNIYSPSQILKYYARINLPEQFRYKPGDVSRNIARDPHKGLEFLAALQTFHLVNVPFENLDLHYNPSRAISINPTHLYHKIVEKGHGRGGYCMESNGLFGTVLRSLGFEVYATAARINTGIDPDTRGNVPRYNGWNHMVHIVSFGPKRYMTDVGNGPTNPTGPLALDVSSAQPSENIAPQLRRLRHSTIPENTRQVEPEQLLWIFELQHEPEKDSPWLPIYAFSDLEFLQPDFETMNFFTSQNPRSWFTTRVVATISVMQSGIIVGTIGCHHDQLKRRERGQKIFERRLKSETERVEALEQHLGITLDPNEREAVKQQVSQI